MLPEMTVFSADSAGQGTIYIGGVADALAFDVGNNVDVVVDWKSDVAPNARDHSLYVAQVAAYLAATGAERGVLVYLTTREVIWIGPGGVRLG